MHFLIDCVSMVYNVVPGWKNINGQVRRIAVRETSVSRHHGRVEFVFMGFKYGISIGEHDS